MDDCTVYEYRSLSKIVPFRRGMEEFLAELDGIMNTGGCELDVFEVHPGLLRIRWFVVAVLRRPK